MCFEFTPLNRCLIFIHQLPVVMEIAVFGEEAGCGVCVDGLLDSLTNITDLINRGFDLLPISGLVETLRAEIEVAQVGCVCVWHCYQFIFLYCKMEHINLCAFKMHWSLTISHDTVHLL